MRAVEPQAEKPKVSRARRAKWPWIVAGVIGLFILISVLPDDGERTEAVSEYLHGLEMVLIRWDEARVNFDQLMGSDVLDNLARVNELRAVANEWRVMYEDIKGLEPPPAYQGVHDKFVLSMGGYAKGAELYVTSLDLLTAGDEIGAVAYSSIAVEHMTKGVLNFGQGALLFNEKFKPECKKGVDLSLCKAMGIR